MRLGQRLQEHLRVIPLSLVGSPRDPRAKALYLADSTPWLNGTLSRGVAINVNNYH